MPRGPTRLRIQEIRSRHNPLIGQVRKAVWRGERTSDGLLPVEGPHLLEEALEAGLAVERLLVLPEEEKATLALLRRHRAAPEVFRLSAAVLKAVSSTAAPQGVVALVRTRTWQAGEIFAPAPALVVILAGVQDPGNAGAILRTAEAFGSTGALLLRGTVHPDNPKFLRAAAGSAFRLPHLAGVQVDQALALCAVEAAPIYALEPGARETVEQVDLARSCALAVGAEGTGIPAGILENARPVTIPRVRRVESLNAAVAAALALAEAARQRGRS